VCISWMIKWLISLIHGYNHEDYRERLTCARKCEKLYRNIDHDRFQRALTSSMHNYSMKCQSVPSPTGQKLQSYCINTPLSNLQQVIGWSGTYVTETSRAQTFINTFQQMPEVIQPVRALKSVVHKTNCEVT